MELQIPPQYHHIADLLWQCQSLEEAHEVVAQYGIIGQSIYELMILGSLDSIDDCEQASDILKKIQSRI